ncbi:YrhK family protein [Thalassospira mesophila]|uniref:Cobalamin biosynthesis protein CobQ n=1 Tax=Thalassospira mesophila TaxID=1293891 RepID=A0A1Y2L2G6_9PROT|nr:YrhK family protein [Thalassospira mesophila]OSQ39367.1 cobalamin biosynthesis protein CobQ [Thalassospira mesophila]
MKLFRTRRFDQTHRHREIYSLYELIYSAVDLLAAVAFIIGSILFFYKSLMEAGTWLFLIGSIFFALRPTVRMLRELHLAALSRNDPEEAETSSGFQG